MASLTLGKRLAWLAACVAIGVAIGALVQRIAGSSAGYLALPLLIAVAWMFVADPTACEPSRRPRAGDTGEVGDAVEAGDAAPDR